VGALLNPKVNQNEKRIDIVKDVERTLNRGYSNHKNPAQTFYNPSSDPSANDLKEDFARVTYFDRSSFGFGPDRLG